MEKLNIFEILYRALAVLALVLMAAFIGFGWLRGYMWEKELRGRRRHP